MLENYIKTALRNLLRNKLHTFLNLSGLGIGLACGLLITLYISREWQYDRYHKNADRIWRVTRSFYDMDGTQNLHLSAIAPPFGTLLPQHFPEIEHITRVLRNYNAVVRTAADNKLYTEGEFFYADEHLFDVFTVPMINGDAGTALSGPWQIALSESAARRFFGNSNPINQVLKVDNDFQYKVTGVYRDFPVASHWHPDALMSFVSLEDTTLYGADNLRSNFGNNAFYTYFTTGQGFEPAKMEARFPKFLDDVFPPPPAGSANNRRPHEFTRLHLQRLTDIHLQSQHDDEIEPGGDQARGRMFGLIALVILLIAGVNYINLATAFSLRRAREIGVRKSTGARRGQIVGQFLSESLLLSAGAAGLGLVMTAIAMPLIKKSLDIDLTPAPATTGWMLAAFAGVSLLSGLLAGLYPAFFMSGFRPVAVLKSGNAITKGNVSLRKALVVFQFSISIALLVGTIVIYRQLHFMQNKELGLDKDRVVTLLQNNKLRPQWNAFRTELLRSPYIKDVGQSSRFPADRLLDYLNGTSVQIGDTMSPLTVTLKMLNVDMDFVNTYQIPIAAGRSFSRDFPTDTTQGWMLNEAAVRAIGWPSAEAAVGKRLVYGGREDCYIVGVLRDFHFESMHQAITPMIFFIPRQSSNLQGISIKLAGDTPAALAYVKQTWEKFNPDFPFDYRFLDEDYGRLYEAEIREGNLYMVFAGLAILIACLGLFGLATFAAHQRTKEIGVRKVLGASVSGITGLLARDFLQLVVVAIVVASPVAYWLMRRWLADFAYRVEIQWWIFALAGLLAIAVAFLTVSYQSIRAALMNPVESLRSE